jgi:hypothetical protein
MQASKVGRTVGVGTRLLARLVHHKAQQGADHIETQAPIYKERGRRLGDGSRRFGLSIWRPFAHASRMLWLEITGLFFALFTLFFAGNLWKLRANWQSGPAHDRFLLYALITLVFAYFTVSSFLRAARQSRTHRKSQ